MTTDAAQAAARPEPGDPVIRIRAPRRKTDYATMLGIVFSLSLIVAAIAMGQSDANFLDVPSILIVILGTMAATSIAYTTAELGQVPGIIRGALVRQVRKPSYLALQLIGLAVLARKRGLLALSSMENELRKDPYLMRAVPLAADGYTGEDIEQILGQEIDSMVERHRRAAGIMRRASEIAPAMGLIGTLVGLVQMLSQLDNPSAIGPAMALALLTTFYGAIMGTVILAPLAAKLERNAGDEAMIKSMIMYAMSSIARQQNPRRLEIILNSELPPGERFRYFN